MEVDPAWLEPIEAEKAEKAAKTEKKSTISVKSDWLIPPLPHEAKKEPAPPKPPPPQVLAVKPRGKLPPPLPRDDGEDEPRGTKSKRPPRT